MPKVINIIRTKLYNYKKKEKNGVSLQQIESQLNS